MLKLKRKKIGDRKYDLVDAKTGAQIAVAFQTGEHGRDNYPWEWNWYAERTFGKFDKYPRSEESLKNIVDIIESYANQIGILKPVAGKWLSGYDVPEGQNFRYAGRYYTCNGKVHGEFNAYVPVLDYRGNSTEIIVRHGDSVQVLDFEYQPAVS